MPKKVALFVDVESLHQHLRGAHDRPLDPALVVAAARARGDLVTAIALADWAELPPDLREGFAAQGVEPVQVERTTRSREVGGRRREVTRDLVDLEVLARIIEVLFPAAGGPEVDVFVLGTVDDAALRAVQLTREHFQKEVVVLGAEGGPSEALVAAASACELLPMPPIEPRDLDGLSHLVPLLEDLERRKRYLNFKYIRETVVRRLERVERSFDAAEGLLSDAIGCGLLLKQKVEDKYNPGQLFTAYCLNREHELFSRFGSGEPAPVHDDLAPPAPGSPQGQPPPLETSAAGGPAGAGPGDDGAGAATPTLAARGGPHRAPERREAPRPARVPVAARARAATPVDDDDELEGDDDDREQGPPSAFGGAGDGRGKKRRRRRRTTGPGVAPEPQPSQLSAGGGRSRGRGAPSGQDRMGAKYEAPSRFLYEEEERPVVQDEDIDEEKILRARGDQ